MIAALRRPLFLAVFAGGSLLVASPQARAQSPNPAGQARFVQMLLNRNARAIQHQFNYIHRQDVLIGRQQFLASLVPANPAQARAILNQLQRIGFGILQLNNLLEPGKFRIISFINQTATALAQLNQVVPPNSRFAQLLDRANQTFAEQVQEAQQIVNRAPATPFVPSVAANVLGVTPGQPLRPFQVRSAFNTRTRVPVSMGRPLRRR